MARPRKEGREWMPENLSSMSRAKGEYFKYTSPITKRTIALGYDKETAIRYAKEANAKVAAGREARIQTRLALKHGGIDERGLIDAETIARRAVFYDDICAIYFLLAGEKIVYVGQSKSALVRVAKHQYEGEKTFNRVFFVACREAELDHLEALYIDKFKPEYNLSMPRVSQGSTVWDGTLEGLLGDAVHAKN